ncbi:MAG: retroviral-like aspartic protease family protein, partial [Tepidisphaeraceae bacterium]
MPPGWDGFRLVKISPFDLIQGLVVIQARISGPRRRGTARLAIDTGATRTIISPVLLTEVGYDVVGAEETTITTGSGVEWVTRVDLTEIEAIRVKRLQFTVVSHALPPTIPI